MGDSARQWWNIWVLKIWTILLLRLTSIECSGSPVRAEQFQFTQQLYNATIPEMAPSRSYVTSTKKMGIYVTDHKLDIRYKIMDGDRTKIFKAEQTRVGDFVFLRIRTQTSSYGSLNRERISKYYLKIKATGQTGPDSVLTSTCNVIINIIDKNDLSPLFDLETYNVSVAEDADLHSSVLTVSASDGDAGINSEIYYSFTTKTNHFAIHPSSGLVTVTKPLNYVLQKKYNLMVIAQDRGPKSKHSDVLHRNANITIHVIPANFYAPEISVQHFPNIKNTGETGLVFAVLNINDQDTGQNGKIKQVRVLEDPSGLFKVYPTSKNDEYELIYSKSFRQASILHNFHITIQATDSGNPSKSTNKKIHINVKDLKEQGAIFSSDHFHTSISEDVPVGSSVLYLQTRNSGSQIQYDILSGNEKNYFQIGKLTGLIRTASELDAESTKTVNLIINGYDPKSLGKLRHASATVAISILDCNDNPPVFNITETNIAFDENMPKGSLIYTVKARDADYGRNAQVSYSIRNDKPVPFEIDHFTGKIKVTQNLDFETMRRNYEVRVRATDWGNPFSRESDIVLNFHLSNVNDNAPLFEKVNCSGYLSREAPIGTEILIITAIDFDYSALAYTIKSGNGEGCFEIITNTGNLSLNCSMQHVLQDQHHIAIVVSDGKFESSEVFVNLTLVNNKKNIKLSNKNSNVQCSTTTASEELAKLLQISRQNNDQHLSEDSKSELDSNLRNLHSPTFKLMESKSVEISENTAVGTSVLKITASDEDTGFNGALRYSILDGDSYDQFKVDPVTGHLVIISHLDREQIPKYDLEIQVSDMADKNLRKSAVTIISVIIKDENDNAPKFERDLYESSVSEGILVNATVVQVIASDSDIGDNGRIVYSLASDENKFTVDSKSGIISVNKALDREKQSEYLLFVKATDMGKTPLSSIATVKVTLQDDNDNVPRFIPESYDIKIREDIPVGAVVASIKAEDLDDGENGRLTYQLLYGVEDTFEIDSETGIVRLTKALDYETKQVYNISAHASDNGSPPLMSACFINVEVIDVNENYEPPEFEEFYKYGIVKENMPVGTYVMQVSARDPEAEASKDTLTTPLTYSIREGTGLGYFSIDNKGRILTSRVLDCETTPHYWLTVYAVDRGLVPLHAWQEIYIKIMDVNDNIPQMKQPIYYMQVLENSRDDTVVGQVQGYDNDTDPLQELTYAITREDKPGYFKIDAITGVIKTTRKKMDRESKSEHVIEVTVRDKGTPVLSSTAQVVVSVLDKNDNKPEFLEKVYRVRVMSVPTTTTVPLLKVTAKDRDEGRNAKITYKLKGKKQQFGINKNTGMIYAKGPLDANNYDLKVQAFDNGQERKKSTARVRLTVMSKLSQSLHSPKFPQPFYSMQVMENCEVGTMLDLVQASDVDGDKLWYSITDGDPEDQFGINPEFGSILVTQPLDREKRSNYNLTVTATDGVHQTNVKVHVSVLDINDNTPVFTHAEYKTSIPETTPVGTSVLTIQATDKDTNGRLFYMLSSAANHVSLQKFEIDSESGLIRVKKALDREVMSVHVLTVMVRDQGIHQHRNFTRVTINVLDENDHRPRFLSNMMEGRVFETAPIGTSILQMTALDQDTGSNGELQYSIISDVGNIGMVFSVDETFGIISLAKPLDRSERGEYNMIVMAKDRGLKPLSSTATVKILVTMSNNAPPKFRQREYVVNIEENLAVGSSFVTMQVDSQSSVMYDITHGNTNHTFAINPSSGVLYINDNLDFEVCDLYNLTVVATNIVRKSDTAVIRVHVLDVNDNAPYFTQTVYTGVIFENAIPNSLVLDSNGKPLVVTAKDDDTNQNSGLEFKIMDDTATEFFTVVSNTGALKTKVSIDHEKNNEFEFLVHVTDTGKPKLSALSPAKVAITVRDINDNPPQFPQLEYHADILLPTASDVEVITVAATDLDDDPSIVYTIHDGNANNRFRIDAHTGTIYVVNEVDMTDEYKLKIQASDGKYETYASVVLSVRKVSADSNFLMHDTQYKVQIKENIAVPQSLTVLQVANNLNQPLSFSLLNGRGMFDVVRTSGVLQTTGKPFDRETKSNYRLIAQVEDLSRQRKPLHIQISVDIVDENDNSPVFVNQPYDTAVASDTPVGAVITQVFAVDRDAGQNGNVTFSLTTNYRDKFYMDRGQIRLQRALSVKDVDTTLELLVAATDQGIPSRMSEVPVSIRIISTDHPVFDRYLYTVSVHENIPPGTPIISVRAISSSTHKLIYSVSNGDPYKEFTVDFNIGIVSVTTGLDYETTKSYNLTLRAADVITGFYAEAKLQINVMDVNDKRPSFTHYKYTMVVSEAAAIGTSVLVVTATDEDTGINADIHYDLLPSNANLNSIQTFKINSKSGEIHTAQLLDFEKHREYSFFVIATDGGLPSLNMSVPVLIIVNDLNDNPPYFDQPSYDCYIKDPSSGLFVTKVTASDPDLCSQDNLEYSITGGNDNHVFQIDAKSGLISLSPRKEFNLHPAYILNISVSDGVFTSFTRVAINIENSNHHSPKFDQILYQSEIMENVGRNALITTLRATDGDSGYYGMLSYSILSPEMRQLFSIDADTGELYAAKLFDREAQSTHSITVAATDNGGRMGFTTVRVDVNDVNDNIPQFLQQEYKISVPFNVDIGRQILQIQARDSDLGQAGQVTYNMYDAGVVEAGKIFFIDPNTGWIRIMMNITDKVDEVFQFFVEAVDNGEPQLRNNVPVEIYITAPNQQLPLTKPQHSFIISANQRAGDIIGKVAVVSKMPLKYSIIPGYSSDRNHPQTFTINKAGDIILLDQWRFSKQPQYKFVVQISLQDKPPVVTYTEVTVMVTDLQDKPPYFETSYYSVSVSENEETGSDVVQCRLLSNGKFITNAQYKFDQRTTQLYENFFEINKFSGWITLVSKLDREKQDMYNLTVVAVSSGNQNMILNTTSVSVMVTDHNDNPPIFSQNKYVTAVNEDALSGTVFLVLHSKDADLRANQEVDYFIVDGDPMGKFKIHKSGEIYVTKALDRESISHYDLMIGASDGGLFSMATVAVDILDANDNSPICEQPIHQVVLSEDVTLSTVITQIKATDADNVFTPNGEVHYIIKGKANQKMFNINKDKGILTPKVKLDRETMSHHHVIVSAVDGGGRSCDTEIFIELSDINDNPPNFTDMPDEFGLLESATPDTLLLRVTAVDPDIGINRQVKYRMVDNKNGTFSLDEDSGVIKLLKAVDRERIPLYKIDIEAYDQGTPSLTSVVTLNITILDENDNPPEFVKTMYTASVPENATVGTSVIKVMATSKDIGINAQMKYSIIAGNNYKKFVIDQDKGIVRVANSLDREITSEYILTILAKDQSDAPLSSSTFVTINVTDVNDNVPYFSQSAYRTSVKENEKVGVTIVQVKASDMDSLQNAELTFRLSRGDRWGNFNIDPVSGKISIKTMLDREKVERFRLKVEVQDNGSPSLRSVATVHVEVVDVNDCPPQFSQDNYTASIQRPPDGAENQHIGHKILQYIVTDDDLDPNGAPFTFDIVSGNEGKEFRIEQTGILSTAGTFNRNIMDSYSLLIRVFDNGTPNLYSDVPTTINIIEEGTNPPIVKNLDVTISSHGDVFQGGIIGTIQATDEDIFDRLTYRIISPNRHLFDIDSHDGRIKAYSGLDSGNYIVNVSVTDQRNIAFGIVNVKVQLISQSMLDSSVTVQIQSLTPQMFLLQYSKRFKRSIKRALEVRAKDVEIINVQPSRNSIIQPKGGSRSKRSSDTDDLDVLIAVKRSGGSYMRKKKLEKSIRKNKYDIENDLSVKIVKVFGDICPQKSCEDGQCIGVVTFNQSMTPLVVDGKSFVTAQHFNSYKCLCTNGMEGDFCHKEETISCSTISCPSYKECTDSPYQGPHCVCPEGKTGSYCEMDIAERCTDFTCEDGVKPMTFSGQSFAKWTLRDEFTIESRLSLSLRVKTRRSAASLMYAGGLIDYSILEIYQGRVQYKFNYGSGDGLVTIPVSINDGQWHTISVERNNKHAELTLDNKYTHIAEAPGVNNVLNLRNNDVYFGADVFFNYQGHQDIRRGFDGCMADIKLFNIRLPFHGTNAVVQSQVFNHVEFHCRDTLSSPDGSNICSSTSCSNGGKCVPYLQYGQYEHFMCICPEGGRYEGNSCEIDTNPCASNPCGGNGICYNVENSLNDFRCACNGNLQGQYCRYGKWCNTNPCLNGGMCIEGPDGYMCLCLSQYGGTNCKDVLCETNPCEGGGVCLVTSQNTYRCNCTANRRGKHCEEVTDSKILVHPRMDTDSSGITQTDLHIIVGVIGGLIFLALLFVTIQCYRRRLSRTGRNVTLGIASDEERDVMLKGRKDLDKKICQVSDFDISKINHTPPSPQPPPVPNRPASYTPSNHDSLNTLNNLDNFHNYGSAADELENCHNIPYLTQDFLSFHGPPPRSNASVAPSLPPPPPSNPPSDTDSVQKASWEVDFPNMLENLEEKKHPEKFPRALRPSVLCPETTSFSSLPVSESEDEPDYHWDASDWAPRPSLPNISEVPVTEIHDSPSSSPHSNESNTHIGFQNSRYNDSALYTDPELLESEYVGDSEFADNEYDNEDQCYMSPPNYHQVLGLPQTPEEEEESYELPQHQINTHPNQYLPEYSFTQSHDPVSGDLDSTSDWPEPPSCDENDVYTSDNDEVVTYGFPNTKKLARGFISDGGITDSESNVRNSVIDRMSMSMGGYASTNASVSDISGLCEIEDTEDNLSAEDSADDDDENTPLNNIAKLNTAV